MDDAEVVAVDEEQDGGSVEGSSEADVVEVILTRIVPSATLRELHDHLISAYRLRHQAVSAVLEVRDERPSASHLARGNAAATIYDDEWIRLTEP